MGQSVVMETERAGKNPSAAFSATDVDAHLDAIKSRAGEGRKARKLAPANIEDFKSSGYIRSALPRKWGGYETTPQEFFRAQMKIAEADMNAGWIGGIIAVHAYQIALMSDEAQADVYGEDPDTCVSSSYNPVGAKVEPADGGFMLSGRWGWSSGSDHCTWCLLGGIIPGEGYRTFLVPQSGYEIEDTWHVMGLEGTGSNDIVIAKPVFVPDYRTHKQLDGFNCIHAQENPIYNIPWAQWFVRVVSTPAIGAAKHALSLFVENATSSSTDPTRLAGDPDVTRRVAEARNAVDEVETIMFRNFDRMVELVRNGQQIPINDRILYRYQASLVIEKMMTCIDQLFDVAGGRSVFDGAPIQEIWRDIHIARAHVANSPVAFARNFGGVMLGGENKDVFV